MPGRGLGVAVIKLTPKRHMTTTGSPRCRWQVGAGAIKPGSLAELHGTPRPAHHHSCGDGLRRHPCRPHPRRPQGGEVPGPSVAVAASSGPPRVSAAVPAVSSPAAAPSTVASSPLGAWRRCSTSLRTRRCGQNGPGDERRSHTRVRIRSPGGVYRFLSVWSSHTISVAFCRGPSSILQGNGSVIAPPCSPGPGGRRSRGWVHRRGPSRPCGGCSSSTSGACTRRSFAFSARASTPTPCSEAFFSRSSGLYIRFAASRFCRRGGIAVPCVRHCSDVRPG